MTKKKKTTGKTGRPRKEDQVKAVFRTVRFSPEEDEQLTVKLTEFGGTRSDFIRKAALGVKVVRAKIPTETIILLNKFKQELTNIGTNLNTIAHKVNKEDQQFTDDDFADAIKIKKELLAKLREIQDAILPKKDDKSAEE